MNSFQYWCEAAYSFRSWIIEILDKVDQYRATAGWHTSEATIGAATLRDGDQPEGKPRPPSGGHNVITSQTVNSSYSGGCCAHTSFTRVE